MSRGFNHANGTFFNIQGTILLLPMEQTELEPSLIRIKYQNTKPCLIFDFIG